MGRPRRRRNECIVLTQRNDVPCASPGDFKSTAWKPGQDTPSLWPVTDQLIYVIRLL